MADAPVPNVAETLAWEKAQRLPAGLLGIAAGVLTLLGGILASSAFNDFPKVSVLDGLRDAAGEKLTIGPGLRTTQLFFYDDKVTTLMLVAVVLALGSAAMAGVLGYLFRATAARGGNLPRIALGGAIVGPIMLAVAELTLQIGISIKAHDFVGGKDLSTHAAHEALQGGLILASQILRQVGLLLVAFSFVLIAINAMRVGLLTRFMGILGMIVGGLFIIPVGSNLPVVQAFWLVAIGVLILDRWPGPAGRPPAWAAGRAMPWPTQQELREAREGGTPRPDPASGIVPAAEIDEAGEGPATAHPASKKRKGRKRR